MRNPRRIPEQVLKLCERVAARLRQIDGIEAVALGGSWSRGTARADSDIDLGLAYDGHGPFSIDALNEAARELDDRHLDGIVTRPGEWGPGVNGGGWLLIDSNHVDFLYRDLKRVREAIGRCVAGEPDAVYQLGHPMGFQNQIYAGEMHYCRPLFDRNGELARLKAMVAEYPGKLRLALVRKHLFDSAFHIEIAGKPAHRSDTSYVSQCLSSAAGFMALVLYALNRHFHLNEKGAFLESASFAIRPARLHDQAGKIRRARKRPRRTFQKVSRRCAGVHRELALLCEKELPAAELKEPSAHSGASSARSAALVLGCHLGQNRKGEAVCNRSIAGLGRLDAGRCVAQHHRAGKARGPARLRALLDRGASRDGDAGESRAGDSHHQGGGRNQGHSSRLGRRHVAAL